MILISRRGISAIRSVFSEVVGDYKASFAIRTCTVFACHSRGDLKMLTTRAGHSNKVFLRDSHVFVTCRADSGFTCHSEGDLEFSAT